MSAVGVGTIAGELQETLDGVPHDDIDLVVLGVTGRSGVAERLLWSTTDRVARSVDATVLIARPQ